MRLTPEQLHRVTELVLQKWKAHQVVVLKADERAVIASGVKVLASELQRESELERDVQKMMDDLGRSNPGEFQRHRMYPLLKQKLAKERKLVL